MSRSLPPDRIIHLYIRSQRPQNGLPRLPPQDASEYRASLFEARSRPLAAAFDAQNEISRRGSNRVGGDLPRREGEQHGTDLGAQSLQSDVADVAALRR